MSEFPDPLEQTGPERVARWPARRGRAERSAAHAAASPAPDASDTAWRASLIELTPVLRAFAWSLSHDAAEADDLVQETLVKAWGHRDRFVADSNLRAWLFTILRNTFYTALARRRREVSDVDGQWAARQVSPASQDWTISVEELRRSLRRLPPAHREALVLVGGAGMTYQEAARVCGCAVGTIKSRVNRARARLMTLMEGPAEA
jgi:RNA polymerase sigma-70 factor (ECF subfamily)